MTQDTQTAERPRVNEVQDPRGRHYELPNGDVVPSVTTFLNVLPKEALVKWKVKTTAEWGVDHVNAWAMPDPEVPNAVTTRGPRDAAVQMVKNATTYDTSARDNGSIVHKILEDFFLGRTPKIPAGFSEVANIYEQIKQDFHIEPLYIEPQLINYTYKYSGSTDAIFLVNGKVTLLDWKAGGGLYGSTAYQTTAYGKSEYILTHEGEHVEMPEIEQTLGIWVRPSGYAAYPLEFSKETWDVVRAARRIFDLTAREWDYRGRPINPNALKSAGKGWNV